MKLRGNLRASKKYHRLQYLEARAAIVAKVEFIPSICVVALTGEKDQEAMDRRFVALAYDIYKIEVIRRNGNNIEISYYDQSRCYCDATLVFPHPSDQNALLSFIGQIEDPNPIRPFTIYDLQALYYWYDGMLCKVEDPAKHGGYAA
jgi:hypothetical protein